MKNLYSEVNIQSTSFEACCFNPRRLIKLGIVFQDVSNALDSVFPKDWGEKMNQIRIFASQSSNLWANNLEEKNIQVSLVNLEGTSLTAEKRTLGNHEVDISKHFSGERITMSS